MSKFKVGDRVRHETVSPDETGTVISVGDRTFQVMWDRCGESREWLGDDNISLVEVGPIRTVTRREIVPGLYGNVEIDEVGKTYVNIDCTSIFYADDLREAAHLFNQLAEVLEENAAAEQKAAA